MDFPNRAQRALKVLVVDDEPAMLEVVGETLLSAMPNVDVTYASDGEEALRRIGQDCPSVVVLNIAMAGKTGFEVLARIRADGNDVPVLLTSGSAAVEVARRGTLDDQRVRFLAKPFKLDELVKEVDQLLLLDESA